MTWMPVPPGWLAVDRRTGEAYEVVGWTQDRTPICAGGRTFVWTDIFGTDSYDIKSVARYEGTLDID